MQTETPALQHGIAILMQLERDGPATIPELLRVSGIPRSSLLRYLQTLESLGMVGRDSDRRWRARMRLLPVPSPDVAFGEIRRGLMEEAARRTGLTVEWYRGQAEGMALLDQTLSDGDVRVVARPGFLRRWGEEVDAVLRLGYAADPSAPAVSGSFWRYSRNGHRRSLAEATVRRAVRMAAREGVAADSAFNSNTIRRAAAVARHGGSYQGVLALAEPFRFEALYSPSELTRILKDLLHAYSLH